MNIDINNNPEDVFYTFLNYSKVSYVGAGSSGLGLQLLNTENNSYKTLTTNNGNVVCSKLFVKLVPIYNNTDIDITFDFLISGRAGMLMYSSLETDFWGEVQKQNIAYKETNENLEPICPPIVYAECQENNKARTLFRELIRQHVDEIEDDDTDDPLIVLHNKYKRYAILKLGVIVMGFTIDYIPLYTAIRNNRMSTKLYLELAIYELLRLYSLGYLHGDFSKANIMINPSYNYTGMNSGRAMLIDFGMTYEHNYTDTSITSILNKMLQTRVPYNKVVPIEHANYQWLKEYITTHGTTLEDTFKELSSSIIKHNRLIINMVQTTYPAVLSQIRNYNTTTGNTNIFTGGFISNVESMANKTSMQITASKNNMLSPTAETMSIPQFNNIFNPNKLDILKLKDAYLRTLMLGNKAITDGTKKTDDVAKGGKKRRKRMPLLSRIKKSESKKRLRTYKKRNYRGRKSHRRRR